MIFRKCPQCDFENPETAKFCNECGSKLGPADTPAAPQPAPGLEPLPPEFLLTPAKRVEALSMPAEEPAVGPPVMSQPVSEEAEAEADESAGKDLPADQPYGERYRIIKELGTGTLGVVYKVFDRAMERELALRTIRPELAQKAENFVGFSRELKIERAIVHKNIARIFELNIVRGTPLIAMEYVAGSDLRSVLKEKRHFSPLEAVSIARQLFSGLAHAHMVGALHHDLRPENIMLDKEGTVKIMDLGVLRLFRAKGLVGAVSGKPQYMSPEQLEGREADVRADIFAAGVILYELLTSNLPPIGQTVRSPQEIDARIPQPLSLLVLRCLDQDRDKRYQTAEEIRTELEVIETIAKQAPVEAPGERPADKPAPTKPPAEPAAPVPAAPVVRDRAAKRPLFPLRAGLGLRAAAGLAIIVLALLAWRLFLRPAKKGADLPVQPSRISLAVLPFDEISPAIGRRHLGLALAETLIRSLGRIDDLFIPAAESSSTFQGQAREPGLIGRRLHVDHYLEGKFEERDGRLRVEARLLRTDSDAPLWSGQFERATAEVFALEEEIADAVSKSLGLVPSPVKDASGKSGGPANFEAYDLYAQARHLAGGKAKEDLEKAIGLFLEAGDKDPSFAPAFAGLGEAYIKLAKGRHWAPDKALPKAKEAALEALLLDGELADAHAVLAGIKLRYEWDLPSAEKEYREALRIEPDNAAAHQGYALLLSALGRNAEAIQEIQAALTCNPLSSEVMSQATAIRFYARLYEDAAAEAQRALAADPLYPGHYLNAAVILMQMNQLDQARQSLKEAQDLGSDRFEVGLLLACLYAREGRRQEVGQILTEALNAGKQASVSQVYVAFVYAALNEREQAMACLENAFAAHEADLISIRAHPFLDPVRGDVRFAGLLKKMGLGSS
jgi:serine/threonine-protein kinase